MSTKNNSCCFYCKTKMLPYCSKRTEKTDTKNLRAVKSENRRIMDLQNCAISGSKKLRLINHQEANR